MTFDNINNYFEKLVLDEITRLLSEDKLENDSDFLSDPLPFDWAGKLTAQVVISANTHWHYVEHTAAIEKWLDKQG